MAVAESTDLVALVSRWIPPGRERDELIILIRLGRAFQSQQRGRRPGFLRQYVGTLAQRIGQPCTFRALIDAMEEDAARRALYGERESPVEQVSRSWDLVTIHFPGKGPRQVTFKTIQNTLTACKAS